MLDLGKQTDNNYDIVNVRNGEEINVHFSDEQNLCLIMSDDFPPAAFKK